MAVARLAAPDIKFQLDRHAGLIFPTNPVRLARIRAFSDLAIISAFENLNHLLPVSLDPGMLTGRQLAVLRALPRTNRVATAISLAGVTQVTVAEAIGRASRRPWCCRLGVTEPSASAQYSALGVYSLIGRWVMVGTGPAEPNRARWLREPAGQATSELPDGRRGRLLLEERPPGILERQVVGVSRDLLPTVPDRSKRREVHACSNVLSEPMDASRITSMLPPSLHAPGNADAERTDPDHQQSAGTDLDLVGPAPRGPRSAGGLEPTVPEHRGDEPPPAERMEPARTRRRHDHLPGRTSPIPTPDATGA